MDIAHKHLSLGKPPSTHSFGIWPAATGTDKVNQAKAGEPEAHSTGRRGNDATKLCTLKTNAVRFLNLCAHSEGSRPRIEEPVSVSFCSAGSTSGLLPQLAGKLICSRLTSMLRIRSSGIALG